MLFGVSKQLVIIYKVSVTVFTFIVVWYR